MTTLVTGASGFVGAAVARCLLSENHQVRVLVRESSDRRNLEGLDIDIVVLEEEEIPSIRQSVDRAWDRGIEYRVAPVAEAQDLRLSPGHSVVIGYRVPDLSIGGAQ